MDRFAPDSYLVDVEHVGRARSIACAVLETGDGLALVDPGPEPALATLEARIAEAGAAIADVRHVLLTHIHLDHAGATGALLRRAPRARVYVHERGAPHLADPDRLLESAARLYGADMQRLWGDVVPVPRDAILALRGDERLRAGGREIRPAYTPGHATHHVAYLDAEAGTAFVGDATGVRFPGGDAVLPVTPPPEVDLDAWDRSLAHIRGWRSERLFLTHFGPFDDVDPHIAAFDEELRAWSARVRGEVAERPEPDDSRDAEAAERFARDVADALRDRVPSDLLDHYLGTAGVDWSWRGLARYWRKRSAWTGPGPEPGRGAGA